jgi:hypothetical protein
MVKYLPRGWENIGEKDDRILNKRNSGQEDCMMLEKRKAEYWTEGFQRIEWRMSEYWTEIGKILDMRTWELFAITVEGGPRK